MAAPEAGNHVCRTTTDKQINIVNTMISKALIKLVRSLEHKKGREKEHLFVAEGSKTVTELCRTFTVERLAATDEWYAQHRQTMHSDALNSASAVVVTADELRRLSLLQHPQDVVALFRLPSDDNGTADIDAAQTVNIDATKSLVLALDGVQDPGNVGTIIRTADWFGVRNIVCSADCADAFAPKVVQSTMGSLAHVHIIYTDLRSYLSKQPAGTPIYGTLLDGDDIYGQALSDNGIIVMGNEGNGISADIRQIVNRRLLIPRYEKGNVGNGDEGIGSAESLNVAIATAVVLAEFRRRGA